MKKVMLTISASILFVAVKAQNVISTYTLTPNKVSSVNVSVGFATSGGFYKDFPTGIIYPEFSKDSCCVLFVSSQDRSNTIMQKQDSIKHFSTGSLRFSTRKQLDSFFICCMVK